MHVHIDQLYRILGLVTRQTAILILICLGMGFLITPLQNPLLTPGNRSVLIKDAVSVFFPLS